MRVGRALRGQGGLTLLELVVVTSTLALLTAIISLSVTGRGTESRAAVQASDVATLQRAVQRYSGEHPQGRFPTLNGCEPERILDLITKECVRSGEQVQAGKVNTKNLEFLASEGVMGVDLNSDGDIDDAFKVTPLIWHKAFEASVGFSPEEQVRHFLGNYIPTVPKHAFEFFDGTDDSWEDGENLDPDELGNLNPPSRITAPAGLGAGANLINASIGQVPTWVIGVFEANSGVEVKSLLPESRY